MTVAAVVSLAFAAFAWTQRNEAVKEKQAAQSRELAANAVANLENDPELSLNPVQGGARA